jgi:NADH-quinone oxidoreductase subunit A
MLTQLFLAALPAHAAPVAPAVAHPAALQPGATMYSHWAALGILFLMALAFGVFNVILSTSLGPKRRGAIKSSPYESGVNPLGNTHQRFNVRFYLVAMIFLLFDVEILFLIPWVVIFKDRKLPILDVHGAPLFGSVLVFTAILLIAYIYAWAKGVLKWD